MLVAKSPETTTCLSDDGRSCGAARNTWFMATNAAGLRLVEFRNMRARIARGSVPPRIPPALRRRSTSINIIRLVTFQSQAGILPWEYEHAVGLPTPREGTRDRICGKRNSSEESGWAALCGYDERISPVVIFCGSQRHAQGVDFVLLGVHGSTSPGLTDTVIRPDDADMRLACWFPA